MRLALDALRELLQESGLLSGTSFHTRVHELDSRDGAPTPSCDNGAAAPAQRVALAWPKTTTTRSSVVAYSTRLCGLLLSQLLTAS